MHLLKVRRQCSSRKRTDQFRIHYMLSNASGKKGLKKKVCKTDYFHLNLNGLLVTRQIDNTSHGGGGGDGRQEEISPWLSQEIY